MLGGVFFRGSVPWGTTQTRPASRHGPHPHFTDKPSLSADQPGKVVAGLVITLSAEAGTASRPAPRSLPALDEQGARDHCAGHERGAMLPQASLPVGDR